MVRDQFALLREDRSRHNNWYLETDTDPDKVEEARLRTWDRPYTALNDLAKEGWGPYIWIPGQGLLVQRIATEEEIGG